MISPKVEMVAIYADVERKNKIAIQINSSQNSNATNSILFIFLHRYKNINNKTMKK